MHEHTYIELGESYVSKIRQSELNAFDPNTRYLYIVYIVLSISVYIYIDALYIYLSISTHAFI